MLVARARMESLENKWRVRSDMQNRVVKLLIIAQINEEVRERAINLLSRYIIESIMASAIIGREWAPLP